MLCPFPGFHTYGEPTGVLVPRSGRWDGSRKDKHNLRRVGLLKVLNPYLQRHTMLGSPVSLRIRISSYIRCVSEPAAG
jgi:hypothetical protein